MKKKVFAGDWFPWYPSIYKSKTMQLTAEQDGIYRRLIDYYMETRHPLPDNDAALARIAGVGADAWAMASAIVRPFFNHAKNGYLYHDFCDRILQEQDSRSKKQSEKGKNGAKKRWEKPIENYEENSNGHASAIADPLDKNATGQDRTKHNKTVAANARAREAGQQGKKDDVKVFSHDDVQKAVRGDDAYDPEAVDCEILPGGWCDLAEALQIPDDRIYQSWGKFKDLTGYPYRRARWEAWLKNEG